MGDGFDLLLRESQPLQRLGGEIGTNDVVADEGPVGPGGCRFADVVEERRQADEDVRRGGGHHQQSVAEHVVRVIAALFDPLARRHLGEDAFDEPALVEELEGKARSLRDQNLPKLVGHPLDRDHRRREPVFHLSHRGQELGREIESELRGEPDGAQHPKRIVAEGLDRIGRGAQHAGI